MKTNYHKRINPIVHGSEISHTPNGIGILVNMITRGIKYNIIKNKRKNG